jgi:long-subunit acyl-CoA synthetase (AMP-forming)
MNNWERDRARIDTLAAVATAIRTMDYNKVETGNVVVATNGAGRTIATVLACLATGRSPLVISPGSPREIRRLATEIDAVAIITSGPMEVDLHQVNATEVPNLPVVTPSVVKPAADLVLFVTSSGTSGSPKAIAHAAGRAVANAKAHCESVQAKAGASFLTFLPMHYSFQALTLLFSAMQLDGLIQLTDSIEAKLIANGIVEGRPDFVNFTPHMFAAFNRTAFKDALGLAGAITIGGSAIPARHLNALTSLAATGPRVFLTYGMTECGPRVSTLEVTASTERSTLGCPLRDVEIKVDKSRRVSVRTPYMCLGIANRGRIDPLPLDPEGFFVTNDIAVLSDAGLSYFGRTDNLIIYKDQKIQPEEIEDLVISQFGAVRTCVIGKEMANMGERLVCRVGLEEGVAPDNLLAVLRAFLTSVLPAGRRPSRIEISPASISDIGKLVRRSNYVP